MIYMVRIQVRESRVEEWETWMRQRHLPDVLRTGCFEHAWLMRDESGDAEHFRGYRTLYVASDGDAFARYQSDHAALLQQEHLELFAGDYEASREALPVLARFAPEQ